MAIDPLRKLRRQYIAELSIDHDLISDTDSESLQQIKDLFHLTHLPVKNQLLDRMQMDEIQCKRMVSLYSLKFEDMILLVPKGKWKPMVAPMVPLNTYLEEK